MKNILFLLFLTVSCKAYNQQTIVPLRTYTDIAENSGYYVKDTNNELQSFEGTWKGTWNGKTIYITFSKITNKFDETFKYNRDFIVGKFKTLNSNGNILFDNTNLSDNNAKIEGMGFQNVTNKYVLSYTDNDVCGIGGTIYITFTNVAKTQLNIVFSQRETILDTDCYFYNYNANQYPEPLPKIDTILTKQ